MGKHGLFVGMVTLDLIYLSPKLPGPNEKIAASDYTVSAGGPATNAAVTFCCLGNQTTLLGVVGTHPITQLIQADLTHHGVTLVDLTPNRSDPPPVSSIIVTQSTGDRAVISLNAAKSQVTPEHIPLDTYSNLDVVLIDGHQMAVSLAIAPSAKAHHIPMILDGGSWKLGLEKLLPFIDYGICSANFYPPGCTTAEDVIAYLRASGIPHIAITHGENPIQYFSLGECGEIPVPQVRSVDTLGAGDIFHGAFCHYILQHTFLDALQSAATIAAHSCQFFGTRQGLATLLEL